MNNKGFSVIELLIAMAIGTVLLLSIMTLFQKNDKTYKTQNVSTEAGQNVRTAMDMIVRELKMAGFGLPAITTPITVDYTGGTTVVVTSTTGIVSGDTIFVCGSGKCESKTVSAINSVASLSINSAFANSYTSGDKLFSIVDSRTGGDLEKILSSLYDDTPPISGPYWTDYSNIFKYTKNATENSISFIAGIDKIMTNLTSSYTAGTSILVTSSSSFSVGDFIIVTGGGEFDSVVVNGKPSSTQINISSALTNDYAVGSTVYKVDVITYNFNSASKTLERGLNGGALQDVAQNIEYFRFKYYDGLRNLVPNTSPYTGITLDSNQRAAVRNINVQAVAITDKENPTNNLTTVTYDDGTTHTDRKNRFFLESDVYLRNTIP